MEGYLSEIRLFGGTFAPRGWAFCAGQIMQINTNDALFSLIGTTYGGNGSNTFALPDFRGRVPVGVGQGPGLPHVSLAQAWGSETHVITSNEMPMHTHVVIGPGSVPVEGQINMNMAVNGDGATSEQPGGNFLAPTGGSGVYDANPSGSDTLNPNAISVDTSGLSLDVSTMQITNSGGSQPVSNMQPYLVLNYIICLEGIYPSRN